MAVKNVFIHSFLFLPLLILLLLHTTGADDCLAVKYLTDFSSSGNLDIQDLKLMGCSRVRRGTIEPIPVPNNNVATNVVPNSVVNTTIIPNVTTVSTVSTVIKNQTLVNVTSATTSTISNKTSTDVPILQRHNLGENGSGIHQYMECDLNAKNISNRLICVSEPIVPDDSLNEFTEPQDKLFRDHNITQTKNDTHEYYNSSLVIDLAQFGKYWDNLYNNGNLTTHVILSNSHRRAVTIPLSFEFPFYGHTVKNVTVASGGFINTGEYIHNWLAATQYIAPLMANFDTTLRNDSYVKYVDNGTSFTVIWENVSRQSSPIDEKFTFAATLYDTGDITFAYKTLPIPIFNIQDESHPIKIGVSDAFIIDRVLVLVRRKTIYEYHKIDFRTQPISNGTLITLTALPTCQLYNTCRSCIQHETDFECSWCESIKRCSNGKDRHRQDWIMKQCESTNVMNITKCKWDSEKTNVKFDDTTHSINGNKNNTSFMSDTSTVKNSEGESSAGAIVGSLCVLIIIGSILGWILYAYRNPHTNSGQLLVKTSKGLKYRPTQWRWRRGEARYTAATIHM